MNNSEKKINLLLVDDDEDEYFLMQDMLEDARETKYSLEWASNYDEALEKISSEEYDVFLVDYNLGKKTGVDLLNEEIVKRSEAPLIMITGQTNREIDLKAMKAGADDYLVKGEFGYDMLDRAIRYCREHKKLISELRQYQRIMDQDLKMAQQIQEHFLPRTFPYNNKLNFAASYRASSHIGGDLYGAFGLREGVAGFHITDVSGHGVSAALVSAIMKVTVDGCRHSVVSGLHHFNDSLAESPDDIDDAIIHFMKDLNQSMFDLMEANRFVTFLMGLCVVNSGEIHLANAGHTPPVLWKSKSESIKKITPPPNLALGIMKEVDFRIHNITMEPGDKIVLYTDGITERNNPDNEEFGEERLEKVIMENGKKSPQKLVDAITGAVDEFAAGVSPRDDQSLLIMEYTPEKQD